MRMISLIYVSRSLIARCAQQEEIDSIVSGSMARNAQLAVRGALIYTERHFGQLLEGPEMAVDELMSSIAHDPRHDCVTIIERKPIDCYRFPNWGLAYWGTASYMDRRIATVLNKLEAPAMAEKTAELYKLMRMLAQESTKQRAPIGRPSSS